MDLKEKLVEKLGKRQAITSSDVAEFQAPKVAKEEVKGDVQITVPEEAKKDELVNAAAKVDIGRSMAAAADSAQAILKPATFLPDKVTITEADREAFLTSVIGGARLALPFSIFNGKVTGKIRSRTQSETYAIIRMISSECQTNKINNDLEYSTRLRNLLLTSQLQELNGVGFVEMKEPLLPMQDGSKIMPPGWLEQAEQWNKMNDGLISALFVQVQIFERKYWTMVNNAGEQNFWNPAESTSK